jgi:hypothetical protein
MIRAERSLPRLSPTCLTFYRTYAVSRRRIRLAFHHEQRSHWRLRVTIPIRAILVYQTAKELSRVQRARPCFLRMVMIRPGVHTGHTA